MTASTDVHTTRCDSRFSRLKSKVFTADFNYVILSVHILQIHCAVVCMELNDLALKYYLLPLYVSAFNIAAL